MTRKPARTYTRSPRPGPSPQRPGATRPRAHASTPAAALGVLLAAFTLAGVAAVGGSTASAAVYAVPASVSPPPSAAESVPLPVCPAPVRGRAGCLAYELAPSAGSSAAAMLSPRGRARTRSRERAAHPTVAPVPTPRSQLQAAAESGQKPQPVTPADLHSAYRLPNQPPAGATQQTIALVDAYNDPSAEADLRVYDHTFGLPECTAANACFEQVNQNGEAANLPFPQSPAALKARESACNSSSAKETPGEREAREAACEEVAEAAGWGIEISTDIEVAHSLCETCRIRLVEAASAEYPALEAAERTAARPTGEGGVGASEISNSWGGEEPFIDSSAFSHPGVVVTASAGDDGYLNWTAAQGAEAAKRPYYAGADYPASSPRVVAVGGTELTLTASGARQSETAWNEDPSPENTNAGGGGGGCSASFKAQFWQREVPDWSAVGCGAGTQSRRAVADVAADGDPYSGVFVYDSSESPESLLVIGGTSVASPIVAATFALAGGAGSVEYPAQTLYAHRGSTALYDVTAGGNGRCDGLYSACSGSMSPLSPFDCGQGALICSAASGYDGPTGVGAPNGIAAFEPGGAEGEQQTEGSGGEGSEAAKGGGGGSEGSGAGGEDEGEGEAGGSGSGPGQSGTPGVGPGVGEAHSGTSIGEEPEDEPEVEGTGSARASHGASVHLSGLALTSGALAAIALRRRAASEIAFAFKLSAAARVRVTLARRIRVHSRPRWAPQPGSFTISAGRGAGHVRLRGSATLPAGHYRVTLAPAHGRARSLAFALE
jgi:hypothetical protein